MFKLYCLIAVLATALLGSAVRAVAVAGGKSADEAPISANDLINNPSYRGRQNVLKVRLNGYSFN